MWLSKLWGGLQGKTRCAVREQDMLGTGESAKFSLCIFKLDFLAEK